MGDPRTRTLAHLQHLLAAAAVGVSVSSCAKEEVKPEPPSGAESAQPSGAGAPVEPTAEAAADAGDADAAVADSAGAADGGADAGVTGTSAGTADAGTDAGPAVVHPKPPPTGYRVVDPLPPPSMRNKNGGTSF